MYFGQSDWKNFEQAAEKEWVVTNGLGGYASATITGAHTRKYHGLLFAANNPPVGRTLLLSKLEEEITLKGKVYRLSSNETGDGLNPLDFEYLQSFTLEPFPIFTYSIENIFIEKRIFMVHGQNSTVIRYHLYAPENVEVSFKITPLANCRNHHHILHKNDWPFKQETEQKSTAIEAYPGAPILYLHSDRAHYRALESTWYEGMYYRSEKERGLECEEDHYIPGCYEITLRGKDSFGILASTEPVSSFNPLLAQVREEKRLSQLIELSGYHDDFANRLVLAADSFIVRRKSTGRKSIIAGYPWFTDWGRDSMIALSGLALATGRFDDAREILETYANYCEEGLIPNSFPDDGSEPWYNTVDASLWFFYALYKYIEYTNNYDFVKVNIYPVLTQIIKHYRQGTRYNIRMEEDGLISAGAPGEQLTWMDAKAGDWVVTPRGGKAVEINALWYNALMVMSMLAKHYEDESHKLYKTMAHKVKESFLAKFWNIEGQCLYDVVGENYKDAAVRPNQILAVALPFSMLDLNEAGKVVDKVWQELYTTYGLRSLSPHAEGYRGRYEGSPQNRDAAYHQGTGWFWLIGPFITAYRKVHDYSEESREMAERLLKPLSAHLRDHGIGTVSEIYDGDWPNSPKGCISQAWSVAEVLRAYVEEVLEIKPGLKEEQEEPALENREPVLQ